MGSRMEVNPTKPSGLELSKILVDAFDSWYELVVANVLWVLFTLPVITAPPALAGLYYSAYRLSHNQSEGSRTFFEGFRKFFWLGWRWALLNLFALAILISNFWFYSGFQTRWAIWIHGILLGLSIIWLALQTFTFPLLMEQVDHRVLVALRNSLVLFLKKPSVCINLCLLLALIAAASTLLGIPWLLFTASLSAYLSHRGLQYLLGQIKLQHG